ncbi:MAG: DNA polymerase III subunit gamma/tau, partial [Oscillospiraceae bacterium]|nr:DNA polymerase III subunit gamma/tau [Oscillospiraceae bacterium]
MYQALYRKWRPMTFDDVVGQPHITSTLKNQIKNNKVAHAYLFTGSRGTGKTTCARIFAKTINCLNPKDGSPCLECEICKAADKGVLNDIIEIDAASNTGVDDIREIRDSAAFLPEICKYKVYIIDEVHMITPNAFNAFLKILEEPPAHVKFIFATTEDHKVLPTITSRCQGFKFNRIQTNDIVERLMYIASQENIQLDKNAASLVAKLSDGGMRDALSLLDQCAA